MVAALSNWDVLDQVDKRRRSPRTITSPTNFRLLEELTYLPPRDRCIVELRFRVGLTVHEIGALTGRSRSSVSRRLATVSQRLHDPLVQALQRHASEFDKEELDIALLHFAGGQGVERIGRDRCLPRRRILNILATVLAWHRHLRAQPGALCRAGDDSPVDPPDPTSHTELRRSGPPRVSLCH